MTKIRLSKDIWISIFQVFLGIMFPIFINIIIWEINLKQDYYEFFSKEETLHVEDYQCDNNGALFRVYKETGENILLYLSRINCKSEEK